METVTNMNSEKIQRLVCDLLCSVNIPIVQHLYLYRAEVKMCFCINVIKDYALVWTDFVRVVLSDYYCLCLS